MAAEEAIVRHDHEEFATMIQPALADPDDGGLSVEVQIEVLDQVVQAMRDALT